MTNVMGGPWWDSSIRGARMSVVAAPAVLHGPLMELLRTVKTTVQVRR